MLKTLVQRQYSKIRKNDKEIGAGTNKQINHKNTSHSFSQVHATCFVWVQWTELTSWQPIIPSTCELLCYGHSHTHTHATTDGIERDNDVWFLNCKFMILSANLIASITKVWTCDRIVCMCHL